MRKEIEARLVWFCGDIHRLVEEMNESFSSKHLSHQIFRSASSVVLNYGEVQSAESKPDFIHKMSVVLKELRETHVNLQIIENIEVCKNRTKLLKMLDECNQLVAMFHAAVMTAKQNSV